MHTSTSTRSPGHPLALPCTPHRQPSQKKPSHKQHSLFFDFICCSPSNLLRVGLGFASVPQVNEGFIYVEDNHGRPGPQATTVAGHFQQISFHGHFSSHTVQPPLTCRGHQRHRVRSCATLGGSPGIPAELSAANTIPGPGREGGA